MLDFAALERALAPIEEVGREEITFEVEGNSITLRPMLPQHEVLVQKFAQESLDGQRDEKGDTSRFAALDYFNRFRVETLAFTLAQVNDTDLRDLEYIPTGESTSSGKPVRVPRHVALRKIIQKWSRPMLLAAFDKYNELSTRIEQNSENLVEYEPSDLTAEIERVKGRLADLEREKERRAKGDPNITAEQVKAINDIDRQATGRREVPAQQEPPAPQPQIPPPTVPTPTPEQVSTESEWATFDEMPTKAALDDVAPPPEEPQHAELPPLEEPPPQPQAPPDPLANVQSSFTDPDDPEALAAEHARLLAARRQMALQQEAREQQPPPPAARRVPPHLRGTIPTGMGPGVSGGDFRAASPEELAGLGISPDLAQQNIESESDASHGGKPLVQRPVETLSDRGRGRQAQQPAASVNPPRDEEQSRNTRFVPPSR